MAAMLEILQSGHRAPMQNSIVHGRSMRPLHDLDCRSLVPRTPPEGLREWALRTRGEALGRSGLVYEAEYVEDYGLFREVPQSGTSSPRLANGEPADVLDEWAKPKKVKMVRCRCSACGTSTLLNWGKDEAHGYGFVHPGDAEGDWTPTVTAAGDETFCPICEERVLVNKASEIGRRYYVTAETSVVSASLVGEENLLALTCWTVQRRVKRSGYEYLEFIPAEAYVFSANDCVQLLGWRNSYSGTAGYFISYCQDWRQPKKWSESWGWTDAIFGLTPELVERSCLPNCKLDVYMTPSPGTARYPVAYLRLYQARPNVEHVLVHGLPRVLHDLIAREVRRPEWGKNVRGLMKLPELDWDESRPAQMLRLTKEELRLARSQDWGLLFWNLFVKAREHGETLTGEDIENAFYLGDDNAADLVGRGPVAKSLRYLLRQCEDMAAVVEEDDDSDLQDTPDVTILLDYWRMAQTLGRSLNDPAVRFPKDLLDAHDRASELVEQLEKDNLAQQFRLRRKLLRKFSFVSDGLLIRPAASQRELSEEGNTLHHCVGSYGKRHATGETAIFFIRRTARPREPYYTLELDEHGLTVRQNRGMRNCNRTPEVQAFEEKWMNWVMGGRKRDRAGKPVVAKGSRTA